MTDRGEIPCGELEIGVRVWTADAGFRPIRWIGTCHFGEKELTNYPNLRPVHIGKDALAKGVPSSDLTLSPQHRVLVQSRVADRMFTKSEVLVSARKLCELQKVRVDEKANSVTYVHLLLDDHHILCSNGALTESLLLAEQSSDHLSLAHFTDRFGRAMPHDLYALSCKPARPLARRGKAKMLVRRLRRNGHAIQTTAQDLQTAA